MRFVLYKRIRRDRAQIKLRAIAYCAAYRYIFGRAGEATWTARLTWDLLEGNVRKAEAPAGTSLPHLAAVPRLEVCPGCHGEQGESANESPESEHGSTPAKIPRSSDGLGGLAAQVLVAGAFSAGSPLSTKWFWGDGKCGKNIYMYIRF